MVINETFEVQNQLGIHARPSASFVKLANKFKSDIRVEHSGEQVDGKSILGMMMLGAGRGSKIKITAIGTDASKAVKQLGKLVISGFDE